MARTKQELDEFELRLAQALRKLASPQVMQEIGDKAKKLVFDRTVAGYGVQDDTNVIKPKKKLLKLSKPYIRHRGSQNVKLNPRTTPSTSNLTLTGELLDSLKAIVSTGKVTISVSGARNKKIKGYVEEQGRPFNNLDTQSLKQLQAFVADILRLLTKYL